MVREGVRNVLPVGPESEYVDSTCGTDLDAERPQCNRESGAVCTQRHYVLHRGRAEAGEASVIVSDMHPASRTFSK